jgi:hypothetical protein
MDNFPAQEKVGENHVRFAEKETCDAVGMQKTNGGSYDRFILRQPRRSNLYSEV